MHPNHAYLVAAAARLEVSGPVLDYGCGDGHVVEAAVAQGVDAFGVESFYGGAHGDRERVAERGLLDHRVRELDGTHIPFEDGRFGLVVHNQVFEHVEQLEPTLLELRRVLRPGGTMLSMFPSREVVREGHCGVPLAHRFADGSSARHRYLVAMRRLGLGTNTERRSAHEWATGFDEFLDRWCHYRSRSELRRTYAAAGFSWEHHEDDFAAFRLDYSGRDYLVPLTRVSPRIVRVLVRALVTMVVVSHRS
jgi:SAM-dependent methyltransferase